MNIVAAISAAYAICSVVDPILCCADASIDWCLDVHLVAITVYIHENRSIFGPAVAAVGDGKGRACGGDINLAVGVDHDWEGVILGLILG